MAEADDIVVHRRGSQHCFPPETLEKKIQSAKGDVWSLGLALYELIAYNPRVIPEDETYDPSYILVDFINVSFSFPPDVFSKGATATLPVMVLQNTFLVIVDALHCTQPWGRILIARGAPPVP